jgi:CRISPR/Cas system-associated protein Csm6
LNDEKLRQAQARAIRMKEWADGPDGLFAVFKAVEGNYTQTLLSTDITDSETREKTYHRINALRDVKRVMEIVIAEGNGASALLDKLMKAQNRKPRKQRTPLNVA